MGRGPTIQRGSAPGDRIAMLQRKEGFKLQVKLANSPETKTQASHSSIYGDNIDAFILMDYDSRFGSMGMTVLVEIRKRFSIQKT